MRLHRVDENVSAAVAPLLAFLRQLQRTQGCAVVLVHHTRKNAGNARAGQTLRGSSELHAWGDSNLYLRRQPNHLRLTIEHRAHPAPADVSLALQAGPEDSLALQIVGEIDDAQEPDRSSRTPEQRVLEVLGQTDQPLYLRELRRRCRIRNETLCQVLRQLEDESRVVRQAQGWSLPRDSASPPPKRALLTFPWVE